MKYYFLKKNQLKQKRSIVLALITTIYFLFFFHLTPSISSSDNIKITYNQAIKQYQKDKDVNAAIKTLEKAGIKSIINDKPKNLSKKEYASILNDYGFFLSETDKRSLESIPVLERVIDIFPARTVTFLNLGDAYFKIYSDTGDISCHNNSVKNYRKYLKLVDSQKLKKGKAYKNILDRLECLKTNKIIPRYPDVWGYEFPSPYKNGTNNNRFCGLKLFKNNNNEIIAKYSTISYQNYELANNKDKIETAEILNIFTGKKYKLTSEEENVFERKNFKTVIRNQTWGTVECKDRSKIRQKGSGGDICYTPFPYYIEKYSKSNKVLKRKTLIYILDKSVIINLKRYSCTGNTNIKKVDHFLLQLIDNGDNTFWAYSTQDNFIMRLDCELNSPFAMGGKLILVDTDIIEKIKRIAQKKFGDVENYNQYILDKVYDYIIDLKKREGK